MQGDSKNRNTGKVIFWKLLDNNKQNKANEHQQSGRKPGGGGGVLSRILNRGVPRRFVNPNPI